MLTKEIKRLSKSEKLLLVQDLWDDIIGESDDIPVSDDEKQYVKNRLRDIKRRGEKLVPWEVVKANARAALLRKKR